LQDPNTTIFSPDTVATSL